MCRIIYSKKDGVLNMLDNQKETETAEQFIEKHPTAGVLAKIGAVSIVIALIALVNGIVVAFELLPI